MADVVAAAKAEAARLLTDAVAEVDKAVSEVGTVEKEIKAELSKVQADAPAVTKVAAAAVATAEKAATAVDPGALPLIQQGVEDADAVYTVTKDFLGHVGTQLVKFHLGTILDPIVGRELHRNGAPVAVTAPVPAA